MNNTNEVFFALLRAGLFSVSSEEIAVNASLFCNADWSLVYQLAQEQSVQGIVFRGIEKLRAKNLELSVPRVLLLQWIGEVQVIEQRNKDMNAFIADLVAKMRDADIYTILVKGQGLAQCYEKPLLRCSGDVDLLLSYDNYQRAKSYLFPIASFFEKEAKWTLHLGMTIDDWALELHGSLRVGLPVKINRVLDDIQTDTFNGGSVRSWMNGRTQVFMLGKENDIVYVFVHFFNHFYKEGVGLRQICDWCRLLWTYRDEIDLKKIERHIRKMGLMSEWKAFGALAVEYIGMPKEAMPFYSDSSRWKRKAKRIMKFIIMSGNMGHNRDMSHFSKYPYIIRKCVSMGRRIGDLINHARIFPLDSLRFFPSIMFNGVRSAIRGE